MLMPIGKVLAHGILAQGLKVLLCQFRAVGIAVNDEVYGDENS